MSLATFVLLTIALLLLGAAPGASRYRSLHNRLTWWQRGPMQSALRLLQRRDNPRPVVDLLAALGAELRAGRTPQAALSRSLLEVQDSTGSALSCPATTAALSLSGDVGSALLIDARRAANASYASALTGLAACWAVSSDTGAGLGAGVSRLAGLERARAEVRRSLSAELAGPRATAALLATLPAAGVLLGSGLGAHPLSWLFGAPSGWLVVVVASTLVSLGLLWVKHILDSVTRTN